MKYFVLFFYCLFSVISVKSQDIVKPNIIIFYADDLGWQDTELNDEGIPVPWETPNMLTLASQGAKFSQAYSPAPTCAPSRSAMMSGHHPTKTKMTHVAGGQIPKVNSNNNANKLIHPYYPGRLNVEEVTIADALKSNGYTSGHIGKWHMAASHNTYPEATDQGFDFQFTGRGIASGMEDRTQGYATDAIDDPYKIDEDGRPFDEVTEEALNFLENNKSEPFFLYMATWLVHTPIQTRDLALLTYYCDKLGIPVPTVDEIITTEGQTNPYYGAMVASLDWSLGKIVDYLSTTDDPRNPGKKLIETTYIFFSSDNGGSEKHSGEIITDNYPLDQGKKYTQEGGIRTPLVISGPTVEVNEFDNVVSHLDFFPTILALTGTTLDIAVFDELDGVDLSLLLKGTSTIVEDSEGNERTDLYWHYPHGADNVMQSAMRSNEYKLYKNHFDGSYELYQLYNADGSNNDIEEITNVINMIPEATVNQLIDELENSLAKNVARYPHWNSNYTGSDAPLLNQDAVPTIISTDFDQDTHSATVTVSENLGDAAIDTAYFLYQIYEESGDEWFESESTTINGNVVTANNIPESATALVFTLIDVNNFLIISEEISTVSLTQITLNDIDTEQLFNPAADYSELVGGITINGNGSYLQSRTSGGGDGAKYLVKSADGVSIVCDKVTFGIRSQVEDVVAFDITIAGETQSFDYTSISSTDDIEFSFNTPVKFTNITQEIEIVTTELSNPGGISPRFRIYDLTFHISEILGFEEVKENTLENHLYPNPVTNVFHLSREVKKATLYNMYGIKVDEFNNAHKNINISNVLPGLYLLKVMYGDNSEGHLKLLKK